MGKKEIIKTDKLCKTFSNNGNMQHVLKNIDIDIYEGDFTVIMGPSGAGKSTLLYALSVNVKDGEVADICELGIYVPDDKERYDKLSKFLISMGW